jgi:ribonuclease P protein component
MVVHVAVLQPGTRPVAPEAARRPARAGFVVGRSVGGSVVRHRVTRQLRHLVAPLLDGLPDGLGVVVRALPPAAGADAASLATDLANGLDRAMRALGQRAGSPRTVSL